MAITLPTEKTQAKIALADYTTLIYGPPKIGKTTFASQFPGVLFLATEPGHDALSVYSVPIATWQDFLEACAVIAKGNHKFTSICIDTVDNLFSMCSEYIRAKHKFEHESDLEYGKGWSLVGDEFERKLIKLSLLPYGLVLISHAEEKEIKTRTAAITRYVPTLPKTARKVVEPMVSNILFCQSVHTDQGEQRLIRTQASENWEAGCRVGNMPDPLPLDYNTFAKAFEEAATGGAAS